MKIAKTIYTPFNKGNFWPVLTVSCNFQKIHVAEISYITEKK